mmetsp:Transcript_11831/g.47580  ORF Transcript_11831/g.47580 Transcript_11831/m.47580 type:complete len:249 (-) Transcript_11831:183-929(-)
MLCESRVISLLLRLLVYVFQPLRRRGTRRASSPTKDSSSPSCSATALIGIAPPRALIASTRVLIAIASSSDALFSSRSDSLATVSRRVDSPSAVFSASRSAMSLTFSKRIASFVRTSSSTASATSGGTGTPNAVVVVPRVPVENPALREVLSSDAPSATLTLAAPLRDEAASRIAATSAATSPSSSSPLDGESGKRPGPREAAVLAAAASSRSARFSSSAAASDARASASCPTSSALSCLSISTSNSP